MRKWLVGVGLSLVATVVYANCTSHSYMINGKFVNCTTCCYNGNCNTTCF